MAGGYEMDQARREHEELERVKRELRAELTATDARITENRDGTLIIDLVEPISVAGETHARLTVGRVRVKHVRAARGAEYELEAYAEQLVSPAGAYDELTSDADLAAIWRAAERQLGKFRRAGKAS